MNSWHSSKLVIPFATLLCLLTFGRAPVQSQDQVSPAVDDAAKAAKFEEALLRRPRTGVALDRFFAFHSQNGSLESYCTQLRQRVQSAGDNTGTQWCLLGLMESQRGRDFDAVECLTKAEQKMPQDALVSFYLARSLNYLGNRPDAVSALQRSLDRKPSKSDTLPILELLGALYLRTQQTELANGVWKRVEAMFPGDELVQDRIISVLAQEGALSQAIERCELQVASEKDASRKLERETQCAMLLAQAGQRAKAIERFESVSSRVNPDSWRFLEIRRRIESLFIAQNDYRGWIEYAQRRIASHPDDLEMQVRLAKTQARLGQIPQAKTAFQKVLSKAPSNSAIRSQFAEFLMSTQQIAEAVNEYATLSQAEPNVADWRVRWGNATALLKTDSTPSAPERAEAIWLEWVRAKPNNATVLVQVANLLTQIQRNTKAIELLEMAVTITPDDPQLIERLGDLQLQAGNPDKAISTWQRLLEHNTDPIDARKRLRSIYVRNRMLDEAMAQGTKVWELAKESLSSLDDKSAKEMAAVGAALDMAEIMTLKMDMPGFLDWIDQASLVSNSWIPTRQVMDRWQRGVNVFRDLSAVANALKARPQPQKTAVPNGKIDEATDFAQGLRSYQLSSLSEGALGANMATEAINKAIENSKAQPAFLDAAIDLFTRNMQLSDAIQVCERLIAKEPLARRRTLDRWAKLCLQTGDLDKAIQLGRQIMEESNLDPTASGDLAELYIKAGRVDEGMQLLQAVLAKNPGDRNAHLRFADQCIKILRNDEAIAACWRGLELSTTIADQSDVIRRLANVYQQRRRLDDLVLQLSNKAMESKNNRLATIWSAAAFQTARDFGKARSLLESLIVGDSLDRIVIEPLISLAEAERNFPAVIEWQSKLLELEPTVNNRWKLATAFGNAGQTEKAEAIYVALVRSRESTPIAATAMEALWKSNSSPALLELCEEVAKSTDYPWPVQGVAMLILNKQRKIEPALAIAKRLSAMTVPLPEAFPSLSPTSVARGNYTYFKTKQDVDADRMSAVETYLRAERAATSNKSNRSITISDTDFFPISTFAGFHATATTMIVRTMETEERAERLVAAEGAAKLEQVATETLWQALVAVAASPEEVSISNKTQNGSRETLKRSARFHSIAKRLLDRGVMEPASIAVRELIGEDYDAQVDRIWSESELDFVQQYAFKAALLRGATSQMSVARILDILSKNRRHDQACSLVDQMTNDTTNNAYHQSSTWCRSNKEFERQRSLVFRELREQGNGSLLTSISGRESNLVNLIDACALDGRKELVADLVEEYMQYQAARIEKLSLTQASSYLTQVDQTPTVYTANQQLNAKFSERILDQSAYFDLGFQIVIRSLLLLDSIETQTKQELLARFHTAAKSKSEKLGRSIADRFAAVALAYWQDRPEELEQGLNHLREVLPDKTVAELMAACMEYQKGNSESAIKIAEPLRPNGFSIQQATARLLLQSAIKAKDLERSRKYAMNLVSIRLTIPDQIKLARTLHELSLGNVAVEVLKLAKARASGYYRSELMNAYQNMGDPEVAMLMALELLEQNMGDAQWAIVRTNSGRDQAIEHIKRFGGMLKAIERAKAIYDAAPKNEQFGRHLANLYLETGDVAKAEVIQSTFVEAEPKANEDPTKPGEVKIDIAALTNVDFGTRTRNGSNNSEQIIAAIKKEPKRFNEISGNWFIMNNDSTVATRLAEVITPRLEEIGMQDSMVELERSMERSARREPVSQKFREALIDKFGYEAFRKLQSQQIQSWLKEQADDRLINRLLDSSVVFYSTYVDDEKTNYPSRYPISNMMDRSVFAAELFVELVARDPVRFERLTRESSKWIQKFPNNPDCQIIELLCLIEQKKWESVQALVQKATAGKQPGRSNSFLELVAARCSKQKDSQQIAWDALESALSSANNQNQQRNLNRFGPGLYLEVAKEMEKNAEAIQFIKSVHETYTNAMAPNAKPDPNAMYQNNSTTNGLKRVAEAYLQFDDILSATVAFRQLSSFRKTKPREPDYFSDESLAELQSKLVGAARKGNIAEEFTGLLKSLREKSSVDQWRNLLLDRVAGNPLVFRYTAPYMFLVEQLDSTGAAPENLAGELTAEQKDGTKEALEVTCLKVAIAIRYRLVDKVALLTKSLVPRLPKEKLNASQLHALWAISSAMNQDEIYEASGKDLMASILAIDKLTQQDLWRFQFDRNLKSLGKQPAGQERLEAMLDAFDTKQLPVSWLMDFANEMAERHQWDLSIKSAIKRASFGPSARDTAAKSIDFDSIQGLKTDVDPRRGMGIIQRSVGMNFILPTSVDVAKSFHRLIDMWTVGGVEPSQIEKAVAAMVLNPECVWLGSVASAEDFVPNPFNSGENIEFTSYWKMPKSLAGRWLEIRRKVSPRPNITQLVNENANRPKSAIAAATLAILACEDDASFATALATAKESVMKSKKDDKDSSGFEFAMLAAAILDSKYLRSLDEQWVASLSTAPKTIINQGYAEAFQYLFAKRLCELEPRNLAKWANEVIASIGRDPGHAREAMCRFAEIAIRTGDVSLAMDFMRRAADLESQYGHYFLLTIELNRELAIAVESMPTESRFELLKKEIVAYHEARVTASKSHDKLPMICLFQFFRPREYVPDWSPRANHFAGQLVELPKDQTLIGLMDYLVSDAKKLGREKEIADWFDATFGGKAEGYSIAKAWLDLIQTETIDATVFANAMMELKSIADRDAVTDFVNQSQSLSASLMEQLVRLEKWEQASEAIVHYQKLTMRLNDSSAVAWSFYWQDQINSKSNGAKLVDSPRSPHWLSMTMEAPLARLSGRQPESSWLVQGKTPRDPEIENTIRLNSSPWIDTLFLKYPLQGSFEATFDLESQERKSSAFGLGGIFCELTSNYCNVFPMSNQSGNYRQLTRNNKSEKSVISLRSDLDQWEMLCDNESILTQPATLFSEMPYVAFRGYGAGSHSITNFRIRPWKTEQTSVATRRSVSMIQPKLVGWTGMYLGNFWPQSLELSGFQSSTISSRSSRFTSNRRQNPEHMEWSIQPDSMIVRKKESNDDVKPIWIQYARPLAEGETIAYEFYYESGRCEALPCIGRTAIHLGPELGREWIYNEAMDRELGIAGRFTAAGMLPKVVPTTGTSPARPIEGTWNRMSLTRTGNTVKFVLNAAPLMEEEMTPSMSTTFGLYCPPEVREMQVRNATLQGDWPSVLPADLFGN